MAGDSFSYCLVNESFKSGPKDAETAFRILNNKLGKQNKIALGKDFEGHDILVEKDSDWLGNEYITVYRNDWNFLFPNKYSPRLRFWKNYLFFGGTKFEAEQTIPDGKQSWVPLHIKSNMTERNDFESGFEVYAAIFGLPTSLGEKYACATVTYSISPTTVEYSTEPLTVEHSTEPLTIEYSSEPIKQEMSSHPPKREIPMTIYFGDGGQGSGD